MIHPPLCGTLPHSHLISSLPQLVWKIKSDLLTHQSLVSTMGAAWWVCSEETDTSMSQSGSWDCGEKPSKSYFHVSSMLFTITRKRVGGTKALGIGHISYSTKQMPWFNSEIWSTIMRPLTDTTIINYSCNLLSTLLGRHQVKHYTLIVSVNSLQKLYKVGSVASPTFQIRKLWLREAKQIAQGHIYIR